MENNNEKKGKNVIEISASSLILVVVLILIVILAINMYLYAKGKPNIYSTMKELFAEDNQVENVIDEEKTNHVDKETGKSYTAYYTNGSSDSFETVKVYEDGTVTAQISEYAKEIWKKDISTSAMQANVEYEISGITGASNVKFLIPDEGGAYVGSYVFLWGQGLADMYLLDMEEAITTGNFIAKKLDISFWISDYPYVKSTFVDGYEKKLVVVENDYGDEYVISRDGTVEKYVASERQEITYAEAEEYIEKFFQDVNDGSNGMMKYQVIDIRADGMIDEYYYYEVDLYIINGEKTEKTTWGLLNSDGNIIRRNIVKP